MESRGSLQSCPMISEGIDPIPSKDVTRIDICIYIYICRIIPILLGPGLRSSTRTIYAHIVIFENIRPHVDALSTSSRRTRNLVLLEEVPGTVLLNVAVLIRGSLKETTRWRSF